MASLLLSVFCCAAIGVSDQVIIVHFTADWCQPCRHLQPSLERLQREGWDVRSVDIDQYPQYVKAYGVKNLPTLVILYNGQEVDRIVGLVPYNHIVERVRRVVARAEASATRQPPQQAVASRNGPANVEPMVRGQSPAASQTSGTVTPTAATQAAATAVTSPLSVSLDQAIARAARATVRIHVEEANTIAHGTGTIIDTHGNEALVLTCGHLFRDLQPGSQISADLFAGTPHETRVPAQLVHFVADDADVGFISIRLPVHVDPVPILPDGEQVRVGQPVFSYGCDHGNDPTRRDSRIKQLDRFLGPANIEIEVAPVVGRSGGGLFDLQGRLIGVCNAADPERDEGIYAAPEVIYAELRRLQLDHLIHGSSPTASAQPAAAAVATTTASGSAPAASPNQFQLASTSALGSASPADLTATADATSAPVATAAGNAASPAAELICIVRTADGTDRVVRIDSPDYQLLQQLEARAR